MTKIPPHSLSIIISTSGRLADLFPTLDSIHRAQVPAWLTPELVVVDNSPTGEVQRALLDKYAPSARLPLSVLREPCRGKARALNTAVTAAKGEVLLFTDDDVRVPHDWMEAMTAPLFSGQADAVAGGVHLAPGLLRPWMEPLHRGWMASTDVLDPVHPQALTGANMAIARHVFSKVPRFDTDLGPGALGSGEESLLSHQIRVAGYRIVPAFDCSVEHHFDPSRLSRDAFLRRAAVEGRLSAYITHHWRHETITFPRRRQLSQWLKLRLKRWFLAKWKPAEGAPVWELEHLLYLHLIAQYLRDRRKSHKYSRQGLVKLVG